RRAINRSGEACEHNDAAGFLTLFQQHLERLVLRAGHLAGMPNHLRHLAGAVAHRARHFTFFETLHELGIEHVDRRERALLVLRIEPLPDAAVLTVRAGTGSVLNFPVLETVAQLAEQRGPG